MHKLELKFLYRLVQEASRIAGNAGSEPLSRYSYPIRGTAPPYPRPTTPVSAIWIGGALVGDTARATRGPRVPGKRTQ